MVHPNSQFGKALCFVALGGNQKNTLAAFHLAITEIATTQSIYDVASSRLYETTPVSSIPQENFLNACIKLETSLDPLTLFSLLEKIEKKLGKIEKIKEAPRLIDLDLLFYGNEVMECEKLKLPHPKWQERLFVLKPLGDLMDMSERLKNFENKHQEVVTPLPHTLPYGQVS